MSTADKIIIIVGTIMFIICDIGVYGSIMKRLRELEDKYLDILKTTQKWIDIPERKTQIYEPSGITKEDIIKEIKEYEFCPLCGRKKTEH